MAPPGEGSIWDNAVAFRGVGDALSIVIGQLRWMWHGNWQRHIHLAEQIWLTVNMVTQWIVRWLIGDHVMVTPTTGQAFHDGAKI